MTNHQAHLGSAKNPKVPSEKPLHICLFNSIQMRLCSAESHKDSHKQLHGPDYPLFFTPRLGRSCQRESQFALRIRGGVRHPVGLWLTCVV